MQNHTPIDVCKAVMRGLINACPDVMFSPRTSTEPYKTKPGFKSVNLVLYSHNVTDLEVRATFYDGGTFEVHCSTTELGGFCKGYIEGFYAGYHDTPDDQKAQFVEDFAKL